MHRWSRDLWRWLWWDLMLQRAIHHWVGVLIGNCLTIVIVALLWWLWHRFRS